MKRLLFMGDQNDAPKKSRVKGYVLKAACALMLALMMIPLGFSTAFAVDTINVIGVNLDQHSLSIAAGNTVTLTATVSPEDATDKSVTWLSSDESIASVDINGVLTGVSAGEAVITVTTVDGGFKAECTVSVTQPVTGVSINPSPLRLCPGDTFTLTAVIAPADATEKGITWSSSDSGIVSVTADGGAVTANALGSAEITAASTDGIHSGVCAVTVVPPSITSPVYTIDRTNGIIPGISKFTSSGQFFSNLDNNPADLSVISPGGSVYDGIAVGTGMSVRLTVNGIVRDTLKLITNGDGNGDGAISISDYTLARLHILGLNILTDVFRNACDVNGDGEITITDYTLLRLDILGIKPVSASGTPVLPDVTDARIRTFLDVALAQRGKPYVLGKEGPDSFDCSGYVYYCLNQSGYTVGRTTADKYGKLYTFWPSVPKDQLQPGDLMFFNSDTEPGVLGHIGIYLGNGYLIHASSTYGCIIICPLDGWYSDMLSFGRRVFN